MNRSSLRPRVLSAWLASFSSLLFPAFSAWAQDPPSPTPITGELDPGPYEYNNVNVEIYDLTIKGPVKITVNNGTILVRNGPQGFGVKGFGANGADGGHGDGSHFPTAGESGKSGFSLTLKTQVPVELPAKNLPITINASIDLHGGNGGSGGNGRDAEYDFLECVAWLAQDGVKGGAGGNGGTLAISANGDVTINDHITTSGGSGGQGGDGGDANFPDTFAQWGAIGGDGGAAGKVTITQPKSPRLPDGLSIKLGVSSQQTVGFVDAVGGNGGGGGAGGRGITPKDGSTGGNGGAGGSFKAGSWNFSAIGVMGANGAPKPAGVDCSGGSSGGGGAGGGGASASCNTCRNEETSLLGYGGKSGGAGGKSKPGGPINITCEGDVELGVFSKLVSHGGDGGSAGPTGSGGTSRENACHTEVCDGNTTAYAAGATNAAGNGAGGGSITIIAWGTIFLRVDDDLHFALLDTSGGNGGQGASAGGSGVICCGNPSMPSAAAGIGGGAGGSGGAGGPINLQYFVDWDLVTFHFRSCGGNGGDGGNGGIGMPPGAAGAGGNGGANGAVIVGDYLVSSPCIVFNGANGSIGGWPICGGD